MALGYFAFFVAVGFGIALYLHRAYNPSNQYISGTRPYRIERGYGQTRQEANNHRQYDNTCTICLDDVSFAERFLLRCGHIFHKRCFVSYVSSCDSMPFSCPNCRTELP